MDHEELSSDDAAITSPVNKGWHLEAQYNPPKGGARIISIKAQPTSLQAVIKAAIREVVGDALFVTAYPNAVTATNYYCDVLKKRAEKLHNVKLHDRFEKDHQFAVVISRLVIFFRVIMSQRLPYLLTVGGSPFELSLYLKEGSCV